MKLIDADLLEKHICENFGGLPFTDTMDAMCADLMSGWVDAEPTVDAVPVIRCKDCKYSYMHMKDNVQGHTCECIYRFREHGMELFNAEIDFCSKAERRENEQS